MSWGLAVRRVCVQVVTALAHQHEHVPFRQSNFTSALQPLFSAGCRTVVLAHITPQPGCMSDTLSTLQLAARMRGAPPARQHTATALPSPVRACLSLPQSCALRSRNVPVYLSV